MPYPTFRAALTRVLAPLAVACAFAPAPASAVGTLADITVIDRSTGRVLPTYLYQGRHYVAGTPGARYAVRIASRSGGRIMSVVAVDGVNVVSGETATWEQNGYVLAAWQRHDIAGWRKTQAEVAAFEFTALPNSYAARTGRPDHVGVIGVALFREYQAPAIQPMPRPAPYGRINRDAPAEDTTSARAENRTAAPSAATSPSAGKAATGEPSSATAPLADRADTSEARAFSKPNPETKLGTGHGRRETSWVQYTSFQRAQTAPDEIISLFYDSRENLIAQGVIPAPRLLPAPNPFPGQPQIGYAPDPPRTW